MSRIRLRNPIKSALAAAGGVFGALFVEAIVFESWPTWALGLAFLGCMGASIATSHWPELRARFSRQRSQVDEAGRWRETHANLWKGAKQAFDKEFVILMAYFYAFYVVVRLVVYWVWGIGWGFR